MPMLVLRGLDAALIGRVRAYARTHNLSLPDACAALLTRALAEVTATSQGGHARAAALSPEQRTESARRAAIARWHR